MKGVPDGDPAVAELHAAAWIFELLGALGKRDAPRVLDADDLAQLVRRYRPGASTELIDAAARIIESEGSLHAVGVYWRNRRAWPTVELNELAAFLCPGAVISLQSVLGECGFLNNPAAMCIAVVPVSLEGTNELKEVFFEDAAYRFHPLEDRFFPDAEQQRFELLQPGRACAMARPEAALLQWIRLAGVEDSGMTVPPVDVDMETLDPERLGRLAEQWDLVAELDAWLARAKAMSFGQESAD